MNRVFFSWQMNTPPELNRYLIRDSLQQAVVGLHRPTEVDEATRGVAGSPSIFETILSKIDGSIVFVADLTAIRLEGDPERYTSNPNVLIEYGYALARLGENRIVPVMNRSFGSAENLPFDLRHKAIRVSYKLGQDSGKQEIAKGKSSLTGLLRSELRLILEDPGSVLSLDEAEVAVARHLLRECADGRPLDYLGQDELATALELDLAEVKSAVANLASRGYLERLQGAGTDSPGCIPSKFLSEHINLAAKGFVSTA